MAAVNEIAAPAADSPVRQWRPRYRLWSLLAAGMTASIALSAIGSWREDHLLLVNATESLPDWAFLIHLHAAPKRGDYIFFYPPSSALLRRHFGTGPRLFGKIVYGVPGDVVSHRGERVAVNGRTVAVMKSRTMRGEPLTPGTTGQVPQGCFFAASPHKDGFDSRYAEIGFVCSRQIVGTGEPIL